MNRAHAIARTELEAIRNRAEALADTLDPNRTFTARSEATRAVVKACDVIVSQSSKALSMLNVSAGVER